MFFTFGQLGSERVRVKQGTYPLGKSCRFLCQNFLKNYDIAAKLHSASGKNMLESLHMDFT